MKRRGRPPYPDVLTPREWEVLGLLRDGLSNEQIAERLGITLRTAKFHVSEILSKLGVKTREQAAGWSPEAATPARRWLAWPLAARIGGTLVVAGALAGLSLLAWGVLRTSGGTEGEEGPVSPQTLLEGAVRAIEGAESFRVEQDFNDDGQFDAISEFAGPDEFHGWIRADPARAAPGIVWYETLATSGRQFSRSCRTLEDCQTWQDYLAPRPDDTSQVSVAVADVESPLGSFIGIAETLQLTRDLRYADDPAARHVRGVTNPVWAIVEALRAELSGFVDPSVIETATRSLDEDANFYDANPAPIEIWRSADGYPSRIVLEQDANHSQGTGRVGARFGRFGEVTIKPPADFIRLSDSTPYPGPICGRPHPC